MAGPSPEQEYTRLVNSGGSYTFTEACEFMRFLNRNFTTPVNHTLRWYYENTNPRQYVIIGYSG
jgi:hypothetical protein